ncbi:MAG: hypothetical protein A3I61_17205 [Acidobacteria bacterium RIFCSPLOWO2_02_FULL_68_18]|nr:MAG: hypothetical protein A3I61_17205 [Acidobacteria bacterium RIFCSPLOWO2_02_FULL_68_18]
MSDVQSQEKQQGEHVFTDFNRSLALGKYNEQVIEHEFRYQGIPIKRTDGKNDFDFFLPNGKSVEVKIDIRSQCTGSGAVEWPTLQRMADYYIYSLTYARVFTHKQLQDLYLRGKIPAGGFGDLAYDGRIVSHMGKEGIPMYQFIRDLKANKIAA